MPYDFDMDADGTVWIPEETQEQPGEYIVYGYINAIVPASIVVQAIDSDDAIYAAYDIDASEWELDYYAAEANTIEDIHDAEAN